MVDKVFAQIRRHHPRTFIVPVFPFFPNFDGHFILLQTRQPEIAMTASTTLDNDPIQVKLGKDIDTIPSEARSRLLPDWVSVKKSEWGELLEVAEWKNDGGIYRDKNGWQGRDLMHDVNASVRIIEYYVKYGPSHPLVPDTRGGVGTTLTGIVHFTKSCESHAGYCHGGSMTSLMDDAIGWVAFLVTGECRPWSGFTVQVNTALKKPIPLGSILCVQARITNVERRKVTVEATISNPSEETTCEDLRSEGVVHATAEGLVVLNHGVLVKRSSSSLSSTPSEE